MNWQRRMGEEETRLKNLVDRLSTAKGVGLRSLVERKKIIKALTFEITDAHSFMEDCLTGRNSQEKYLMKYQVRMQFPLFSHLDSLFSMSEPVFSDSSLA
jgi:hypothetical protein